MSNPFTFQPFRRRPHPNRRPAQPSPHPPPAGRFGASAIALTLFVFWGATLGAQNIAAVAGGGITSYRYLKSISVTGPSTLAERSSAQFTATALFSDGSSQNVTSAASWSENSAYASIAAGLLTVGDVPSNQTVTVTAAYTFNGTTRSGSRAVTVTDTTSTTLASVTVTGPSSVPENAAASYAATAAFSNGTTQNVTASAAWSENSSYATIAAGVLTTGSVSANQSVTVTATYSFNGVTKSGSLAVTILNGTTTTGAAKVLGWNDLGMHCMDADFSVFSILPPYNNPHAQVIGSDGRLVKGTGTYHLTYEGIADATGSINTTSRGKSNFWTYAQSFFGAALPPDVGLEGNAMPGTSNIPQPLGFEPAFNWFLAKGVPITPVDDAMRKNPYPMMKLAARDASNAVVGSASVVIPVSDEMTCIACHGSGSGPAAQPASGWVYDSNPERDYRLNILKLHDQHRLGTPTFTQALQAAGYSPLGLYDNAVAHNDPILCDRCHLSNALPVAVTPGIPSLTQAMHAYHGPATNPATGTTLEANTDRSACYTCHPGSVTRCLRGAMGNAVAADASFMIQCQDCHGRMSTVGASTRQGWFQEPTCQNCHTGTASQNNGQIRYTSAFDSTGKLRTAVNATFATNPNTPASGISLYRFSSGHGGVQCEACHGSTHAEYPSAYPNDNVQSIALQGHKGVVSECSACHGASVPSTTSGGPHGLHPMGQGWIDRHPDAIEAGGGTGPCQACHGTTYRGSVLSRMQANRTLTSKFGTINAWRGFQITCYACHNGPGGSGTTSNRPAQVANASASTSGTRVTIPLSATDADGNTLALRVVSQPAHGRAGLTGTTAVYIPDPGFAGSDSFTFAAFDGSIDSNLGTVTVAVSH